MGEVVSGVPLNVNCPTTPPDTKEAAAVLSGAAASGEAPAAGEPSSAPGRLGKTGSPSAAKIARSMSSRTVTRCLRVSAMRGSLRPFLHGRGGNLWTPRASEPDRTALDVYACRRLRLVVLAAVPVGR